MAANMCAANFYPINEHIHLLYKTWESLEATSYIPIPTFFFTSLSINIIPLLATFKSFQKFSLEKNHTGKVLNQYWIRKKNPNVIDLIWLWFIIYIRPIHACSVASKHSHSYSMFVMCVSYKHCEFSAPFIRHIASKLEKIYQTDKNHPILPNFTINFIKSRYLYVFYCDDGWFDLCEPTWKSNNRLSQGVISPPPPRHIVYGIYNNSRTLYLNTLLDAFLCT